MNVVESSEESEYEEYQGQGQVDDDEPNIFENLSLEDKYPDMFKQDDEQLEEGDSDDEIGNCNGLLSPNQLW